MFIGIIAMRSVAEQPRSDEEYMALALDEAALAAAEDEVPVGAVLVGGDGTVLARGRNRREELADPTAHAEIEALRSGSPGSGGWRREGATLYVTLEPCPMCMGALVLARVRRVVFGATLDDDPRFDLRPADRDDTTMTSQGPFPRLPTRSLLRDLRVRD